MDSVNGYVVQAPHMDSVNRHVVEAPHMDSVNQVCCRSSLYGECEPGCVAGASYMDSVNRVVLYKLLIWTV